MWVRELGRPIVGKLIGFVAIACVLVGGRWIAFSVQDIGTVSPSARSEGDDGLWLSHLWVDGRENAADVTALAAQLRGTGIRDLFVHTGPFNDDGTLDASLRPKAQWFVSEIHQVLPGVRVQAWLGQEVEPVGDMNLESASTRADIVASVRSVLADGFDGVHFDFEPVATRIPGISPCSIRPGRSFTPPVRSCRSPASRSSRFRARGGRWRLLPVTTRGGPPRICTRSPLALTK